MVPARRSKCSGIQPSRSGCRADRRQKVDGGDGRVVRRAVGDLEPDPGQEGIRVLPVARRARRETDAPRADARQRGLAQPREHRRGVEPWRPDLLERRIGPPSDRQVGALEEAGARIVKEALERPQVRAGRDERKPVASNGMARLQPATGTTASSPAMPRSARARRASSPSVSPCRMGTRSRPDGGDVRLLEHVALHRPADRIGAIEQHDRNALAAPRPSSRLSWWRYRCSSAHPRPADPPATRRSRRASRRSGRNSDRKGCRLEAQWPNPPIDATAAPGSAAPRKPCSGLKSATSRTPAARRRTTSLTPSHRRPTGSSPARPAGHGRGARCRKQHLDPGADRFLRRSGPRHPRRSGRAPERNAQHTQQQDMRSVHAKLLALVMVLLCACGG